MKPDTKKEFLDDPVHEDSEEETHNPPAQNEFEKAKWNSNGYDQSGMK